MSINLKKIVDGNYALQRALRVLNIKTLDNVAPNSRLIECYIYPKNKVVSDNNLIIKVHIADKTRLIQEDCDDPIAAKSSEGL